LPLFCVHTRVDSEDSLDRSYAPFPVLECHSGVS
jgi:hypothetical protein